MLYRVVHQRTPTWLVGERQADVWARRRAPDASDHAQRYPGDHPGRVALVRPAGEEPLEAFDGSLYVSSVLDLTKGQAALLASRQSRLAAGTPVPTTFRDRHGAVAVGLEALYADPEKAEADEEAALQAGEPIFTTNGRTFSQDAADLAAALPSTETSTGTGLYAVKETPGTQGDVINGAPVDNADGTWTITVTTGGFDSTWEGGYVFNAVPEPDEVRAVVEVLSATQIMLEGDCSNWSDTDAVTVYDAWSLVQGACDQVWTDQGSATFTATQYVRVYAGTYDENVEPNAAFVSTATYQLVIEGDPAAGREEIIVAPSGGANAIYVNCDYAVIRHLRVAGTPTTYGIYAYSGCAMFTVDDVEVELAVRNVYTVLGTILLDSAFTMTADEYNIVAVGQFEYMSTVRGCTMKYTGGGRSSYASLKLAGGHAESCVFTKGTFGIQRGGRLPAVVVNCTYYDCGVGQGSLRTDEVLLNNVFLNCDRVLKSVPWPEETATKYGPRVVLRNNCYHGYTNFSTDGSTNKTYAEFTALGNVDAAGDLDAVDPLLADPGAGDFSLQAASPCRHAGHGAGVTKDVNGDDLDPYHPDVGAVSTGIGPGRTYGAIG